MPAKVTNQNHGAIFLADLKRRLFLEGLLVAVPEPDTGDDLWVLDRGIGEQEDDDYERPRFFRCQSKSAVSCTMRSGHKVYTVNFTRTYKSRIHQGFYFLIGIYDRESDKFQVGCFPGEFFQKLKDDGNLRFNEEGRPILDLFVIESDDGCRKYELRMKYPPRPGKKIGRGPRKDVSEFFAHDSLLEAFASSSNSRGNQRGNQGQA